MTTKQQPHSRSLGRHGRAAPFSSPRALRIPGLLVSAVPVRILLIANPRRTKRLRRRRARADPAAEGTAPAAPRSCSRCRTMRSTRSSTRPRAPSARRRSARHIDRPSTVYI